MNDWRSRPRRGKAEFMKHLDVVKARLQAGHTQSSIRITLRDEAGLEISAAQFSRYVQQFGLALVLGEKTASVPAAEPKPSAKKEGAHAKAQARPVSVDADLGKPSLKPVDFRKIRQDVESMDLDALIKGKGIVYVDK